MHDVGLWLSFSSCRRQLSFGLFKPVYAKWDLISIGPQVVCKVSQGKTRERSFHLMQKKKGTTSEEFTFSTHGY